MGGADEDLACPGRNGDAEPLLGVDLRRGGSRGKDGRLSKLWSGGSGAEADRFAIAGDAIRDYLKVMTRRQEQEKLV